MFVPFSTPHCASMIPTGHSIGMESQSGNNCLEMKKYNSFPRRLQLHCTLLLNQFQGFISGIAVNMSEEADKVLH